MTRPIEPQHLKRLHAQIRYALGCYKMHQQINGNGDTIDLVDVVTPPMEDNIAEGQIELDALAEHLVDYIEDYVKTAVDQQPPTKGIPMKPTEEMIGRFLSWKLPDDFRPDAGISYTKPPAHCPTPSGTNLFHYSQAKEMLEYVMAVEEPQPPIELLEKIRLAICKELDVNPVTHSYEYLAQAAIAVIQREERADWERLIAKARNGYIVDYSTPTDNRFNEGVDYVIALIDAKLAGMR